MSRTPTMRRKGPRCPVCGRPRSPEHRPFCSRRCRDVDLHRWLSQSYAIPAVEQDDERDDDEDNGGA